MFRRLPSPLCARSDLFAARASNGRRATSRWPIPLRALRDDGVSQHYLAPGRYVEADEALAARLVAEAAARGLTPIAGATWTIPTPYRTTEHEIQTYRAEGVLATEMSTAALFAVASALGARAASILMISRVLGVLGPPPRRDHDGRFFVALDAAIAAIRAEAEPAPGRKAGR
ncbi:MAG: hypothetical protein LC808_17290 [Actinobacteria bacterium]|nr:hypothetical protein [Actinomycetota bacterium]